MRALQLAFFRFFLVYEISILAVEDKGNEVHDPSDKVTYTGEGSKNSDHESNDVLGLEVTDDTVDAANDCAADNLNDDSQDERKLIVGLGKGVIFCHN